MTTRFGFDDAGVGFDQAPLRSTFADLELQASKALPALSTSLIVQAPKITAAKTHPTFRVTVAVGSRSPIIPDVIPPPLPPPRLIDLLIGQWQQAPRLVGVVALLQTILDDGAAAKDRMELMLNVDAAEGVWLDYRGRLLGIDRPGVSDPTLDVRFGFDDAGVGFDQAPLRGAMANDAIYPLPDPVYRRMVKARAVAVFGDGTIYSFVKAVKEVDRTANVYDFRNMSVMVGTGQRRFMQVADDIGALPRAAGVQILYGDRVTASGFFYLFNGTATVSKR